MPSNRVLLIQSAEYTIDRRIYSDDVNYNSFPPLGLLYIATILQNEGFEVKVCDMSVEQLSKAGFSAMVRDYAPSFVGLGVYASSYTLGMQMTREIKRIFPDVPVWLGGPFATFTWPWVLRENPEVDGVVMYEGEQTALELARACCENAGHLESISGLVFRADGELRQTARRQRLTDLDALPFPNRDLVQHKYYSNPFTISTARGCVSNCIFCSSRAYWGAKYVLRSPQSIFAEVKHLAEKHPAMRTLTFADDTLIIDRDRVLRLCDMLEQSGLHLLWGCLARVDEMDEELAARMKAAGCHHVKFGIESGSDEVLRGIGKKITLRQVVESVKILNRYGIKPVGSLILGLPQDTLQTMEQTIDFACQLKNEHGVRIQIGLNTPFPGTPQFERSEAFGIKVHTLDWDLYDLRHAIVSTSNFSRDDLVRLYSSATLRLHIGVPQDERYN